MTDTKPTGPAAAAIEIDKLQEEWFCRQITSREPNREERASTIEAIILKHCPQDKAVYRADFLWGYEDGSPESIGYEFCNARNERYRQIQWEALVQAIVSKYHPDDKVVGKLVEALKEARVKLGFPLGKQPIDFLVTVIHYRTVADTVKIIDSALEDHEKAKDTSCG